MAARELGRVTLAESLALTALITEKAPHRCSRYAVRWLRRLIEEDPSLTIEEASLVASEWPRSEAAATRKHCRRSRR